MVERTMVEVVILKIRIYLVIGESEIDHFVGEHATLQNVDSSADSIQNQFQTKCSKHTL